MSLLTEALRLREGRRPSRGESGPSFPPFRGPRPGRWIAAVTVLCLLAVLGWWKGGWLMEKVEVMAGVVPPPPAPNLLASAPREAGGGEKAVVPPAARGPETGAEIVAPPAAARAASGEPVGIISEEGKKQGEILLTDGLVKAVAEKPAASAVPNIPEGETPVAAVPTGGLQPMKVELAEAELVMATPEEREKKRVELVEEFLRVLRVQGVRLQGKDSRILVDGAPIGLGERVGGLGLVLESVEPQKIIFSDASGRRYPKSY